MDSNKQTTSNMSTAELAKLAACVNSDPVSYVQFDYSGEMQDDILCMLWQDRRAWEAAGHLIKPGYFPRKDREQLCEFVLDYWNKYDGVAPKQWIMHQYDEKFPNHKNEDKNDNDKDKPKGPRTLFEACVNVTAVACEPALHEINAMMDLIQDFAQHQATRELILKAGIAATEGSNRDRFDKLNKLLADFQLPSLKNSKRRIFNVEQFLELPRAKYLIRKHVVERSLCLIYGHSGAGKSFLALDVSFCVATGRKLFGQWESQEGAVLYLVSEGDGSFGVRLQAYCKHHGIEKPKNLLLLPEAMNFQDSAAVVQDIKRQLKADQPGFSVKAVCIDTLNKNIGGNENDPKEMQAFIATCEAIKKALDCTVIVIHHTGKDDSRGARGHSSLFAAADSVIKVQGSPDEEMATIICEKQKSAKPFGKYNVLKTIVEVDPMDVDNPDSVVLTYAGEGINVKDKLKVLAGLFPTGKDNAIPYKNVLNDENNKKTLAALNWEKANTLRENVKQAAFQGLLAQGEPVFRLSAKGHKTGSGTKTYFRPDATAIVATAI